MSDLYNKIETSLITNDTEINRKYLAKKIISEKIDLRGLLYILDSDENIATHFIWLVGYICELSPETVFPELRFIFHSSTCNFYWLRNQGLFPGIATLLPGTSRHQGDLV